MYYFIGGPSYLPKSNNRMEMKVKDHIMNMLSDNQSQFIKVPKVEQKFCLMIKEKENLMLTSNGYERIPVKNKHGKDNMTTSCKLNNQFAIMWNKNCIQMYNLDGEFEQNDINFYIPIR